MPELKNKWLSDLAKALTNWISNPENLDSFISEFSDLGDRQRQSLMRGSNFIGDKYPDLYARLFRLTRLKEADPRTIPPTAVGIRRNWTNKQLVQWWKNNYPHELDDENIQSLLEGWEWTATEGEEDHTLIASRDLLTQVLAMDSKERAIFCAQNMRVMKALIRQIQTLTLPEKSREASILLMNSLNK